MKKIILSGFSVLFAGFTALALAAPAGQIQNAAGDVKLITKTAAPKSATAGSAVDQGTMIQTGKNSHAVIRFADGQLVALDSNSTFRLDEYQFDLATPETSTFVGSFLRGAARFVTGLIGDRNRSGWRVDTPLMTAGIRGSDWLTALRNNNLYVGVQSGGVNITNSAGTLGVDAGQGAILGSATTPGQLVSFSLLPANVFGNLPSLSLSAFGGSAAGAGGATIGGVSLPAVTGIVIGVGAAAGLAASGGGSSTATHH